MSKQHNHSIRAHLRYEIEGVLRVSASESIEPRGVDDIDFAQNLAVIEYFDIADIVEVTALDCCQRIEFGARKTALGEYRLCGGLSHRHVGRHT